MRLFLVSICFVLSCSQTDKSKKVTINSVVSKTIPGLTAADVHGNYTSKGFLLKKNIGSDFSSWTCIQYAYMKDYMVTASGGAVDEITNIDIAATFSGSIDNEIIQFIGYAASIPYKNASPSTAKEWAIRNINSNSETTIGDVHFRLIKGDNSRILKIYAE